MATLENLLSNLEAADGVLAASYSNPQLVGQNLNDVWTTDFVYAEEEGAIANIKKHRAIAFGANSATADAYWMGSLPEPLRVAPTVVYFSDRTVSTITAAQIESYCNSKWETLHANTDAILNFSVVPVSGNTVLISGVFDLGDGTWQEQEWYVTLVDPNGAVTAGSANVKFRRKV